MFKTIFRKFKTLRRNEHRHVLVQTCGKNVRSENLINVLFIFFMNVNIHIYLAIVTVITYVMCVNDFRSSPTRMYIHTYIFTCT